MPKLLTIAIIVLIIGSFLIITTYDFNMKSQEGQVGFVKAMGHWIFQVGRNTVSAIGFVVRQDWKPDINLTNSSNTTKNR